jgi:arginine repressor
VYDRAEVIEVVRHLSETGFIGQRSSPEKQIDELGLIAVREEEEREKYWFIGDQSHWYQAEVARI